MAAWCVVVAVVVPCCLCALVVALHVAMNPRGAQPEPHSEHMTGMQLDADAAAPKASVGMRALGSAVILAMVGAAIVSVTEWSAWRKGNAVNGKLDLHFVRALGATVALVAPLFFVGVCRAFVQLRGPPAGAANANAGGVAAQPKQTLLTLKAGESTQGGRVSRPIGRELQTEDRL